MKWFNLLTDEEINKLGRECFLAKETHASRKTGKCIFIDRADERQSCSFDDFMVHDIEGDTIYTKKYMKFMAKRFGMEYMKDILWHMTGIEEDFWKQVIDRGI